jgi:hypothetical protein
VDNENYDVQNVGKYVNNRVDDPEKRSARKFSTVDKVV